MPGEFARRLTDGNPAALVGRELTLGYAALAPPSSPGAMGVERRERKFRVAGILEREPGPMLGGMLAPVMVPLPKARELASYDVANPRALFDRFSSRRSYMSATVRVARPQDTGEVQKKIKEMGFLAFSLTDALAGARRVFIILDILLGLVGSIALVVASLGIVNTMVMSILERTREIGVMKAVGGDDADVRSIFLVEAATIGLAGGAAGVILGWGVGRAINFGANVYIASRDRGQPHLNAPMPSGSAHLSLLRTHARSSLRRTATKALPSSHTCHSPCRIGPGSRLREAQRQGGLALTRVRGMAPASAVIMSRQPKKRSSDCQRSSGFRPVCFAIRASMCGPISSSSWNAKTKSGCSDRESVRCEPDWRLICQPILSRAASTRRAFAEGQRLKLPET